MQGHIRLVCQVRIVRLWVGSDKLLIYTCSIPQLYSYIPVIYSDSFHLEINPCNNTSITIVRGQINLPRVELRLDMKTPLVILLMKEVFPTAASPANTTYC